MFHPGWRQLALSRLGERFDVVILGGGITGCGILLDAAQRGLSALLVEKGDIASGTSSRSSKLIHGGLRYLRQMQFRITRLACRERDRMAALNPDLVRSLSFLYPARAADRLPGWTVDFGLWMYDRLTEVPERHRELSVEEITDLAPGLEAGELDRALVYRDAFADDARLTLAVAATGFAYGGLVLTRAEVEEAVRDAGGRIRGVVLRDLESGAAHNVEAAVVVNAAGVWVDAVRARFGLTGERLRPSRGSHLILARERLPLHAAVTAPSPEDGRPVFFIPHPEGVLVGTTDLYHEGALDDPRPTRAEADYLLRAVVRQFPNAHLGPRDVLGAFAGLRPILTTHAEKPSEASREEDLWTEEGMLSVAGGKLTTWRVTAEEVVDAVLDLLPEERARQAAPCATAGTALAGLASADLPARLRTAGAGDEIADGLAWRLRGASWRALDLARSAADLKPLAEGVDLCAAEVRTHLRYGAVVRLEDLLLRRVRLGMWRPRVAMEIAPTLSALFAEELGWDAQRFDRELDGFAQALTGWRPEGLW